MCLPMMRSLGAANLSIMLLAIVPSGCGSASSGAQEEDASAPAPGRPGRPGSTDTGGTQPADPGPAPGEDAGPGVDTCAPGGCATEDTALPPEDGTALPTCTPGATRCLSAFVEERCDDTGRASTQPCGAGEQCFDEACRPAACVPGENTCAGSDVYTCDAEGQPADLVQACGAAGCERGVCVTGCGDGKTYVGCEFWGADLDHWEPGDRQQYAISVSNPGETAVQVEIWNGEGTEVARASIAGGTLTTFPLPRQDVDHTSLSMRSYRVVADGPISAHQFNPLNQSGVASNDASLLLPTPALGREYLVLGWPTVSSGRVRDGRSYMTIIASEEATEVTVRPVADIEAGSGVAAIPANTVQTFTLSRGQVLSLGTNRTHGRDLTGSRIQASAPVAVFFGHECADIPLGTCCCDHIEQQLFPIEAWGTSVVAAKFAQRGSEADLWRVLASENNTVVTLTPAVRGVSTFTLQAGEVREVQSTSAFLVESTAPVLVGQFLTGSSSPDNGRRGCSGFLAGNSGDPAFTLNVPTRQWLEEYIVLTPEGFSVNHLTIVTQGPTSVTLDGSPLSAAGTPIAGTDFTLYRPEVSAGVHRVRADRPVGLYAYGFDCYVSYAYPGGLRLDD